MKKKYFLLLFIFSILSNYCKAKSTIYNVEKDTAVSRLYLELGIEKYEEKNYKGALNFFVDAIKNDEGNWKAYRYKGKAEYELKKYQESIEDYTKAISLNKSDTLSYIGRAEAYRWLENWQEALKNYTIAREMGSNNDVIYFQSGFCNYKLKRYKESIENYTEVINILASETNDHDRWLLNITYSRRGQSYYDYKKYREAINDYNIFLTTGKEDPYNVYSYRGRAYLYLSKTDSALIDFNTIIKQFPNNAFIYKYMGMAYALRWDSSNARKNFKQSISINSNDPEAYFYWATTELGLGNYSKAVELLETALKSPEPEPSFDAYYSLAFAKVGVGDTLGAITAFNKAVAKDSNRYELYDLRTYFLIGDMRRYHDQLIKDFTSMIRLIGDTNAIISSLLYEKRGFIKFSIIDSIGAKADINKAIEILPNEPIYYVLRAAFNFYLTDNKDLMLKDLDKAISLDSKTWEAYVWKAGVYERYKINNRYIDSDYSKACENLKMGIKNGAKVSMDVQNYICKGKLPKDGKLTNMFFYLIPKFKNQELKDKLKK